MREFALGPLSENEVAANKYAKLQTFVCEMILPSMCIVRQTYLWVMSLCR